MFLFFPADFATRSEQKVSESLAGRPVGGGGDGGGSKPCCEVADELNGALNRGFFPVVFTDCGHFFSLNLRSTSARFLDEVFFPGFCLGDFAPGCEKGGGHDAAERRRLYPATIHTVLSDAWKSFQSGYLSELERHEVHGATL
jgi:hypothetical protein